MRILHKKTKQPPDTDKSYGYLIPEIPRSFSTGRTAICLIKALLVFCASFGTIGSILSAFDMPVNMIAILSFLIIASLILAFLHYNHVLFNICYPLLFFVFAFSILKNRIYVNSGYQAVLNIIKEAYGEYFDLAFTRQATEAITHRYTTITFTMVFLGFFLVVLLNIAISTYMSTFWTIALTFPFLQFGLYIEKNPSPLYIFLLLFAYISVAFFKNSGHFQLSENQKKDYPFVKKKNLLLYKGHGKTMGQLVSLCLALSFGLTLISYPALSVKLPNADKASALKAYTDKGIQNLVQNGITGMFNRYEATGGISGGLLGGVSSVRSDYETDLEVTFVPTSMDTIYLKAFTGATYTSTKWLEPSYSEAPLQDALGMDSYHDYSYFTAHLEANRLALFKELNPYKALYGKMEIKNIGADDSYQYVPYYTANESNLGGYIHNSILYGSFSKQESYTLSYYPYSQDFSKIMAPGYDQLRNSSATNEQQKTYMQYYDLFSKLHYSDVPTHATVALEKIKEEIGEADSLSGQLALIQSYFEENYPYSLSPGATPYREDFVTYFLEKQKKGYCAHFATAGTLLCRLYGIPARYVEGYIININNLADASLKEGEALENWLYGTSSLEDTGVITVSVPDANAHAWTEIYVEGFGWMPVDFTPPSSSYDTAEEYSTFLDLFSGLFSLDNAASENIPGTENGNAFDSFFTNNSFFLIPALVLTLLFLCVPLLCKLFKIIRTKYTLNKYYSRGDYDKVLAYYYALLCRKLKKAGAILPDAPLINDVFTLLSETTDSTVPCGNTLSVNGLNTPKSPDLKTGTREIQYLFQKGMYAGHQLTKEEADTAIRYAKKLRLVRNKTSHNI